MGWASGDEVFEPVARKLLDTCDDQVVITEVLAVLINGLQEHGWDTEGESLGEFQDDEAVVEAFRRCGIVIKCDAEVTAGGASYWCERERGERGHADGQHEDGDAKWPVTA